MGYEPIENHGIVGDMHSAALVSLDGSVDWLCLPRFDSPSVFGAILKSLRVTTWSASSSFGCMMSILSLTPTTARRSLAVPSRTLANGSEDERLPLPVDEV